ncbi:hypothetical protein L873DRAFT_192850 [Choiromyces venosus 120613-1]|uniref:Uncharacterized protein n=1 Tax=Choiromyces venosus 120613-1 TaxID=1336337 RepID=A0A3N4JF21_9PEZI|nr:hypothetical protein L873DRAFT_192850 [Choiromyces venosus 120613-1]
MNLMKCGNCSDQRSISSQKISQSASVPGGEGVRVACDVIYFTEPELRHPGGGKANFSVFYKILVRYKVGQEAMEQLFNVNKPNISLSVPVNRFLPLLVVPCWCKNCRQG